MSIDRLLMVIFLLIAGANVSDVIADYQMHVGTWHLVVEGTTVVISILAFLVLWRRIIERRRELKSLQESITRLQSKAASVAADKTSETPVKTTSATSMKGSYPAVQNWFKEWKLSPSEQQVAVLLIKGLSFNEIASVRNTKEKTVRQQASSIYAKSGLSGRNNLSAWLIDALLE
jgi:DNA-binding NarL/FixJ family response regulator